MTDRAPRQLRVCESASKPQIQNSNVCTIGQVEPDCVPYRTPLEHYRHERNKRRDPLTHLIKLAVWRELDALDRRARYGRLTVQERARHARRLVKLRAVVQP